MGWDRIGWDGMGWDGMGWDGMGQDRMGWGEMGWDGMEWNGTGQERRGQGRMRWVGLQDLELGGTGNLEVIQSNFLIVQMRKMKQNDLTKVTTIQLINSGITF